MNRETVWRLDRINRDFYAAHAEDFLATRAAPWSGWARLLPHLRAIEPPGAPLRILDVGCGNGRLGTWLDEHLGRAHRYFGVDRSLPLLAKARGEPRRILADLVASGGRLPNVDSACDAVLVLALLHHIPSRDLRRALVADLLRLLRPQGLLVLSCWQFATEARFQRRMMSPRDYNRDAISPIDVDQLEEGDHLLLWGDHEQPRPTVRYCHFTSPEDAAALLAGLPGTLVETYYADGRDGRLNLYLVARRS